MACEKLQGCLFFNDKMPIDTGLGKLYKESFCEGDFASCAGFRVAQELGREKVPQTLYPNMDDEAEELIKEGMAAAE